MSVSDDVLAALRAIATPTLANAIDVVGAGGVMAPPIQGVGPGLKCVGRAITVAETTGPYGSFPVEDFRVGDFLDIAGPGDVIVVANGGAPVSTWGGMASYAATVRGIEGLVVDGGVRDREEILEFGFPVFSRHVVPTPGKGRLKVEAIGEPIICGGVRGGAGRRDRRGRIGRRRAAGGQGRRDRRPCGGLRGGRCSRHRGPEGRSLLPRRAQEILQDMNIHAPIAADTLQRLKEAAGPGGAVEGADTEPYCVSWRDNWAGKTPLVLRPDSTARVAEIVRICAETGTAIVPQGGNTGLTGAGQPRPSGDEIVLCTTRMKAVRAVDPLNDTITVEAGVTLLDVQNLAAEADRYFPLSLAAEGTCQIGGNLATNAGGVQVLRYGSARALCLGLEVVTADGEIWDGLRGLRKDNAGYDMKQLFIGSEGTLGIITAATLRLFPRPVDRGVALVAVPSPAAAVELLARLRGTLGELLSAFELMNANTFRFAETAMGHADPLPGAAWRVLIQADGPEGDPSLSTRIEMALGPLLEEELITDAVIATSEAQAATLWRIREDQAEVQQKTGAGIKHDVSVPVSAIDAFVAEADAALDARYAGIRHCTFGHAGDGNLHYNPIRPEDWTDAAWKAETEAVNRIVHDIVLKHRGSITAEHGVGRLRREELGRARSKVELNLMRAMKQALDPKGILNPGKVLPD